MRDTSFLGKLLALTESTNPHEANLAKTKLQQQLEKRGIDLDQLEAQLGDMSVVEEEIEVFAFRYGRPYKRVDPAVSIILGAVADYYNGKIVFTPFKFNRSGNSKHQKEYIRDKKGDIYRQMEITANKARRIEIEIYTDYLVQALQDAWDLENDSYKTKRRAEYPKFEDQFDQIYNEGIDAWKATIKTIKDKYPKP